MNKRLATQISIIVVLFAILGVEWYFVIDAISGSSGNTPAMEGGAAMGGGSSSASYSAVKEITTDETIESGEFNSSNADENAIMATGEVKVSLAGISVTKTGDSDGGDSTSFYGTNSAILAKGGANLTIKNANITTDATGANGVFSYGGSATTNNTSADGTTVNISDSTIETRKDNSGGIMTTGGGIMKAENLTVKTAGTSSAAIRSDRGGGTVTVNKGTYETSGKGSPVCLERHQQQPEKAVWFSSVRKVRACGFESRFDGALLTIKSPAPSLRNGTSALCGRLGKRRGSSGDI